MTAKVTEQWVGEFRTSTSTSRPAIFRLRTSYGVGEVPGGDLEHHTISSTLGKGTRACGQMRSPTVMCLPYLSLSTPLVISLMMTF